MSITIDGYLTQSKLAAVMRQVITDSDWVGTELKIENTISNRYRWDMGFVRNGVMTYVEFDGSQHYTTANAMWRDDRKDSIVKNAGAITIRIPYWVQLTTETMAYYFDIDVEIDQDFPHGFIDKKAEVPASFCEMGIRRFVDEFSNIPSNVKKQVAASIMNKAKGMDMKYIVPTEILTLLEPLF